MRLERHIQTATCHACRRLVNLTRYPRVPVAMHILLLYMHDWRPKKVNLTSATNFFAFSSPYFPVCQTPRRYTKSNPPRSRLATGGSCLNCMATKNKSNNCNNDAWLKRWNSFFLEYQNFWGTYSSSLVSGKSSRAALLPSLLLSSCIMTLVASKKHGRFRNTFLYTTKCHVLWINLVHSIRKTVCQASTWNFTWHLSRILPDSLVIPAHQNTKSASLKNLSRSIHIFGMWTYHKARHEGRRECRREQQRKP